MDLRVLFKFCVAAFILATPLWASSAGNNVPADNLSIRRLINEIWQINPGILSAESNVDAARANATALSRPIYNPELELDGERVYLDKKEDTYTIGLNQTLDLSRKRTARRHVGLSELGEAHADLAVQRLSVGTAALIALGDCNTAQKVFSLAKKRTQLLKKFVNLTKRKYAAGDLGQAALDQSYLSLSESITQQVEAEVMLNQSREVLSALIGHSIDLCPTLPKNLPSPPHLPTNLTEFVSQLPAVLIQNHRVATANARVKVAKTNTRPDPEIGLRGGQDDNELLLGLNLTIPLFVRNNFRAEVDSARQQAIAVDKTRMNTYWQTTARLESVVIRYKSRHRAYHQWRNVSASSLNQGIKLLDKLWQAGEIDTTEYLIQLKQRLDSQIAGVELQGLTWQTWFEWLNASNNLETWLSETA